MRETFQRLVDAIVQKQVIIMKGVSSRDQSGDVAVLLTKELVAKKYSGDAKNGVGHELSHLWAGFEIGVSSDVGILMNRFTGVAAGAFVKADTKDPEKLMHIAEAPNGSDGIFLTDMRMSEGDIRVFHRNFDAVRARERKMYGIRPGDGLFENGIFPRSKFSSLFRK